jgi:hypothetical protein
MLWPMLWRLKHGERAGLTTAVDRLVRSLTLELQRRIHGYAVAVPCE